MSEIRTLLVDDEPLARQRLRTLLRDEPGVRVVGECGDGAAAVEAIRDHAPDLVFLDVQMPEVDGFGVLDAVGAERMPPTIFVTAYDRYAVRAFDVHAVDYLLKPFARERFRQAMERARAARPSDASRQLAELLRAVRGPYLERVPVTSGPRTTLVRLDEVEWIGSAGNYLELHAAGGTHLLRGTLKALEPRLDPARWVRVSRAAIVNVDRIVQITPAPRGEHAIRLRGGDTVHTGWGFGANLRALIANPL